MPKDDTAVKSPLKKGDESGTGKVEKARTIDLVDDKVEKVAKEKAGKPKAATVETAAKDKAEKPKDATQAKSSVATPASRLKAPPKVDASTPVKAHKSAVQDRGLLDDALTQVAQQKFEAQEEKLKDVARHAIASLRDYSKLSESEYAKKIVEIRKALLKYEMQYVRVWELQDRTRQSEIDESEAVAERMHTQAVAERDIIVQLTAQLETEKKRKRRYEAHEAAAAEVNKKRARTELQADIDTMTKEIEQLRQQKLELKEQAELIQKRGQLLREAAVDMEQLLVSQMQSSAGVAPALSQASVRKSTLVEVIS